MRNGFVLFVCVFLLGCVSGTYTDPNLNNSPANYSVTLSQPYDEVWKRLVTYASTSFFAIDNFEKDSGLMTLTFGSSEPSKYVDCGTFKISSPAATFEGPYVDYMKKYSQGVLNGKMNIAVIEQSPSSTMVQVRARYILTGLAQDPYSGRFVSNKWSFDTGLSDTVNVVNRVPGSANTRTCGPTYLAEQSVINALR